MTKDRLVSILKTEIEQSYTGHTGEITGEIAKALDYYNGEPLGTEEEGSSQVISMDVQDTIEWTMPSLMRVFASQKRAMAFDPVKPGDDEGARQETDIVNHVFYKENDGFLQLYTFLKDALLSKVGVMKIWWDPTPKELREEYKNQSDEQLMMLLGNDELEPMEHTVNDDGTHDIAFKRVSENGRARVEAIPIEEFRISKDANSIMGRDARFKSHRRRMTVSQLIESGFPKKKIKSFSEDTYINDEIAQARYNKDEDTFREDAADPQMREVYVDECYTSIDFDGDGIAELRQITLVGNEIWINEETDDDPFAQITPVILTHKFHGKSVADMVMDLQLIKSTLLRQILNNTYLANNPRTAVWDGEVNLDDLLTSRSGGVVRTSQRPQDAMMPFPHSPLPTQTFDVLASMDKMRKERTGISDESMGLEANVLAHGRTGVVNASFDAARMRTELIARVFAETGVKEVFRKLHAVLQKNQTKAKWIKLRGSWVNVNPAEWRERTSMSVNVGLGTGNKDRQIEGLSNVIAMQEKLLAGGLGVTPENIYNALIDASELYEFDGTRYFTDPSTQQPPEPGPDPQMELIQAQKEIETAKNQTNKEKIMVDAEIQKGKIRLEEMKLQQAKVEHATDTEIEKRKLALEAEKNQLKEIELRIDEQTEMAKVEVSREKKVININRD